MLLIALNPWELYKLLIVVVALIVLMGWWFLLKQWFKFKPRMSEGLSQPRTAEVTDTRPSPRKSLNSATVKRLLDAANDIRKFVIRYIESSSIIFSLQSKMTSGVIKGYLDF